MIITQGAHFMSRAMFSAIKMLFPHHPLHPQHLHYKNQMHDSKCEFIICPN